MDPPSADCSADKAERVSGDGRASIFVKALTGDHARLTLFTKSTPIKSGEKEQLNRDTREMITLAMI